MIQGVNVYPREKEVGTMLVQFWGIQILSSTVQDVGTSSRPTSRAKTKAKALILVLNKRPS